MKEPSKEQCRDITQRTIDFLKDMEERFGVDSMALDALVLGICHSRLERKIGPRNALKICEEAFYSIGWKTRQN